MKRCYINSRKKVLHTIERRKPNRIGYNFRRNCLLKDVIEGKIEGKTEESL
jgi:hypothetical protein